MIESTADPITRRTGRGAWERVRLAAALGAALSLAAARDARAELFGIFNETSTVPAGEVLGVIDPATGAITVRGDVLDVGPRPSGVSDVDPAAGVLYFNAADGAAGPPSLWSIELATGTVLDVAAFSGTGLDTSPHCLVWDSAGARLLGVVSRLSDLEEVLVEIDPATAAMTQIGATAFDNDGFGSGSCDYDAAGGVLFFPANPPDESQRALFQLDADTGAVLGSPMITTAAPSLDTTPGFFAWDPVGERGLAIVGGNLERRLGEIDPETGVLTPVGATIASSGYSGGVSDFDPVEGVFYYVANEPTNTSSALFQVTREGALLDNPVLTSADPDVATTPTFLAFLPVPAPGAGALGLATLGALAALARSRRS